MARLSPTGRLGILLLSLLPVLSAILQAQVSGLWGPDFGLLDEGSLHHHRAALELLETGRTSADFHPPGYAVFVAAVYFIAGPAPAALRIVQIGLLPIVVAAGAAAGRAIGGRQVGWGTAALMALHPALPRYALRVHGDLLLCLGVALVAAGALPLLRGRKGSSLIAGLGLALAVFIRPPWALLGPSLLLAGLAVGGFWRTGRALALPALLASAVLALNIAWFPPEEGALVRGAHAASSSMLLGSFQFDQQQWDWTFLGPGDPTWERYAESRDEVVLMHPGKGRPHPDVKRALREAAWQRYREPGRLPKKLFIGSARLFVQFPTGAARLVQWAFIAIDVVIGALALLGLVRLRKRALLVLAFLFVPLLLHSVLHVEPRYAVPARVVWYAAAWVGWLSIWANLPPGQSR